MTGIETVILLVVVGAGSALGAAFGSGFGFWLAWRKRRK